MAGVKQPPLARCSGVVSVPGVPHVVPEVGEQLVQLAHRHRVSLVPDISLHRVNVEGRQGELEVRSQILDGEENTLNASKPLFAG